VQVFELDELDESVELALDQLASIQALATLTLGQCHLDPALISEKS
jgi:hypothetical protein